MPGPGLGLNAVEAERSNPEPGVILDCMRSHTQRCRLVWCLVLARAVMCYRLQPGPGLGKGVHGRELGESFLAVPAGLSDWAWELGWLASAPGSTTDCLSFSTCKTGSLLNLP